MTEEKTGAMVSIDLSIKGFPRDVVNANQEFLKSKVHVLGKEIQKFLEEKTIAYVKRTIENGNPLELLQVLGELNHMIELAETHPTKN